MISQPSTFKKTLNLSLHLTENCNMRCSYCYIEQKKRTMPWKIVRKSVEFLAQRHPTDPILSFVTAEPLFEWEKIKKTVEYAQRLGIKRFDLSTNGVLLNKEILEYCSDHNIILQLSFDGRQKIHHEIRRLKDDNRRGDWLNGKMQLIKRYYPKHLEIRVTFTPETVTFISDSIKFLMNTGIAIGDTRINIVPVVNRKWEKGDLNLFKQQLFIIADLFIKEYRRGRKMNICFSECFPIQNHLLNIHRYRDSEKMFCRVGEEIISVDSHGKIWPCYWVGSAKFKQKEKLCFGNISSRELKIRNLKKISTRRRNTYLSCKAWNFLINGNGEKPLSAYKCFFTIWCEASKYVNDSISSSSKIL